MIIGGTILMPVEAGATEEYKDVTTALQGGFIENLGQWPDDVLFMANTKSLRAWITKKGMVFEQFENTKSDNKEIKAHAVMLEYINPRKIDIIKSNEGNTKFNFIHGQNKSKHVTNAKIYNEAMLVNVFDNIDMKLYLAEGELRYDFIVHPQADPNKIRFKILGSEGYEVKNNALHINTSIQTIVQKELFAYQKNYSSNAKNAVNASFQLDGNILKFNVGEYDKSKELVIDPLVQIDLYVYDGGTISYDGWNDVSIYDRDVYLCGYTNSATFPSTVGIYQGDYDVIIASEYYAFEVTNWITIFGSPQNDFGIAMQATSYGVYVTGTTESMDFPIQNEYYSTLEGSRSNFFTLLNIYDGSILQSTYLGNSTTNPNLASIKVYENGDILLSGEAGTDQTNPFYEEKEITSQYRVTSPNTQIGFIMCLELNFLSPGVIFSSLFGGDTLTEIRDIDLDASGNIYLTGITLSTDASFDPTTNAYDVLNNKNERTNFVTKLHLGSTNLEIDYNSFYGNLGNDDYEGSHAIYVYKDTVYIGGYSTLDSIPQKRATDSIFSAPDYEAFVAAFVLNSTTVNDLIYSSYMGGDYNSMIKDLSFDEFCNHLLFVGSTYGELDEYYGHIYEPFNGNHLISDIMVGALNFNNIFEVVLDELAYVSGDLDAFGNALVFDHPTKMVYTCGINQKVNDTDMLVISLSKSFCTSTQCPCPESSSFWLSVTAAKREEFCEPGQCYVTHFLDIPEFYADCFNFVQVSTKIDSVTYPLPGFQSLDTFNVVNLDKCINEGEFYEITLVLMRTIGDENPCIITHEVYCRPDVDIEPCTPEHFDVEWKKELPFDASTSACPDCQVIVHYVHRKVSHNGDFRQDLQIVKFELLGTGCDDCAIEDIYRNAIVKLIDVNDMKFVYHFDEVTEDSCMFLDRVALGGCFGRWEYYIYNGMTHVDTVIVWESCLDTFCCWQGIKACPDTLGGFTITNIEPGQYGPHGLCEETTIVNQYGQLLPCIMACNWNANLPGYYEFPGPTQKRSYSLPNINSSNSFGIRVFNFGNNINLQLRANQQARASLSVFDLTGRLLKRFDMNCSIGENTYNLDITDLANGIFIYAIEINGLLIKSDKLLKY
jgi:hypothetical protein